MSPRSLATNADLTEPAGVGGREEIAEGDGVWWTATRWSTSGPSRRGAALA